MAANRESPVPVVGNEPPIDATVNDGTLPIDSEPNTEPVDPPTNETNPADDGPGEAVARVDLPADPETSTDPVLPPVDKVMGHYISSGQVMVGWNQGEGTWKRLPSRTPLKPEDRLRTLPTYRTQIMLTNDIQVKFSDECIAVMENPVEEHPALRLISGKTIIATMGKAGNAVSLFVDRRRVDSKMVDDQAAVALSVRRFHLPGDNPELTLSHVEVAAVVTSGQVEWNQAGAEPVAIIAGQRIVMVDDGLPRFETIEAPPLWVKTNDISDIDRLASATLEPMLDEERPMEISLAERAEHPRVEVRSVAARSLASIDRFEAMIDSFGDESLKSYWSDHFDHLQSAMARSPETAAQVRGAIERRMGDGAERFYRLLQGYSAEQLKMGDAKLLVDYLQHDSLDVRVLAINNLRRITGRTFGYHPHLPEARRRTALRQWIDAAKDGSVTYLNPPPALPKRKSTP